MFKSQKLGSVFEMEPTSDKLCWLLFISTLLSFGTLYLHHVLFCYNAGVPLVYNSILSQLCWYHKSLWTAGSHFFLCTQEARARLYCQ